MPLNKWIIITVLGVLISACQSPKPSKVATPAETKSGSSTRAQNVLLDTTSFDFPAGQNRVVWIYLPPDYKSSAKHYPVLYMHDGQNIFDDKTSYVGEWGVDEALNHLSSEGWEVPIVVAINHGNENRVTELSPWSNEEYPEVNGKAYAEFIVNGVKPMIDKKYRTLHGPSDTSIMGSSMGGLMSHYMLLAYPDVFGKAAIFSPSFWFSTHAFTFAESNPPPSTHRLLFIAGSEEGEEMSNDMNTIVNLHLAQQHPESNLYSAVVTGGQHNETFWKEQFVFALKWLGIIRQNDD